MLRGVASLLVVSMVLLAGCAAVPMAPESKSSEAKQFSPPPDGEAGLYVFRDSQLGGALKKDIWVDGECLGESASRTFFYRTVAGDKEHTISTESEFSPNNLVLFMKAGVNYFVRQYIKLGLFVGGANLKVVDATEGENAVRELGLAEAGTCSE